MSEVTRDHVHKFWTLLDEILNSVLFLLIGFEVLVVSVNPAYLPVALLAIPIVVGARFVAVSSSITALSLRSTFTKGAIPVLTWGGLRGGISVALVLSLPQNEFKPLLPDHHLLRRGVLDRGAGIDGQAIGQLGVCGKIRASQGEKVSKYSIYFRFLISIAYVVS